MKTSHWFSQTLIVKSLESTEFFLPLLGRYPPNVVSCFLKPNLMIESRMIHVGQRIHRTGFRDWNACKFAQLPFDLYAMVLFKSFVITQVWCKQHSMPRMPMQRESQAIFYHLKAFIFCVNFQVKILHLQEYYVDLYIIWKILSSVQIFKLEYCTCRSVTRTYILSENLYHLCKFSS